MDTFEQILGNVGDTPPSVSGAESAEAAPASAASDLDSILGVEGGEAAAEVETPAAESPAPAGEASDALRSEDKSEGEESEAEPLPEKPEEAEEEITDEAIEKALADKRTGKWFKNAVGYKNNQLTQARAELDKYRAYGPTEELEKLVAFKNDLYGFEEKDGTLQSTAPKFAENLLKQDPDKAIELINALVAQPSPLDPEKNIFEQLLETPEVEEFLKERYGAQDQSEAGDLSLVPENLREAYQALPKELKAEFKYMSEAARNAALNQAQAELVRQKQETELKERQRQETLQRFDAQVQETQAQSFNSVTDGFKDSLKQIPFSADPGLNKFLQSTVYDKVLTVATMGETYAGRLAAQDLQEFGINVPGDVAQFVKKLESDSKLLTQAVWQNNKAAEGYYASEIATTQKQLVARANDIAGQISAAVGKLSKRQAESENLLLDATREKARPAIDGQGGDAAPAEDLSHLSYEEIFAAGR